MPDSVTVPARGQRGTVTITGVVVAGIEPGRDGAMVVSFDIGDTGDELVVDLLSGHASFEVDPPESPRYFPPTLPGEIWSARDSNGTPRQFIVVTLDGALVFTPLHHNGPWDRPFVNVTTGFMLLNFTGLQRLREGLGPL